MNRATILGNLGRDPEFTALADGSKMCRLSVATSEQWRDANTGEIRERTEWHNVAVFGGLVKVCESRLKKGTRVYIEGPMQTRKYTDKNGVDRYSTSVIAGRMGHKFEIVANAKPRAATMPADQAATAAAKASEQPQPNDDETPF